MWNKLMELWKKYKEDEVLFEKTDEDPVTVVTTSTTLSQATSHNVIMLNEKLFTSGIWKCQVERKNHQFKRRNEQWKKGGMWHDPAQRKYSWTIRAAPWFKYGMFY